MATISVICYKSKTLANGEHPLVLRITKDGKRKYKYLGVSVLAKYWDFKKNIPKIGCPNNALIKQIILDKESDYQKELLRLKADNKEYTARSLLNSKQKIKNRLLEEVFIEIIEEFKLQDKLGNTKVYRETYNSIVRYTRLSRLDFAMTEITTDWLLSYENWLINNGNKQTTISIRFRTLRSLYNKAIEREYIAKEHYPFNAFKISKYNTKTKKRAITKEEIKRIIDIDLSQDTYLMQFTRDVFIFSYLHGGINLTDIANLKSTDLQSSRICYIRQKTNQEITIPLLPIGQKIIDRWKLQNSKYLFPILNEKTHITAQQKFNRIHKYNGHINKHLKEIAKLVQIEINLTTYVARHLKST